MSQKKALVIAVSEYDNLGKLDFCKNDGDDLLNILKDLGYEIKNRDGLLGYVDGTNMQDAIYDFFKDEDIKSDDTLLFYFSGHGIPGAGDFFLASSNIELKNPKKRGFSFDDLNGEIANCRANRLVMILDSCYAGSAKIDGKGDESAMASAAKSNQSMNFKEGEGRCLLSSCMGFQESFSATEGTHSFFTNYLLKGLAGAEGKSVSDDGRVTPESLMRYIDREIDELPKEKRPQQTPLRKITASGNPIELAYYPKLAQNTDEEEALFTLLKQSPRSVRRPLAVGLIRQSKNLATGFLIGPNIIMTDRNVFPTKESVISASIEFNSQIDARTSMSYVAEQRREVQKRDSFDLDPDDVFFTSDIGYSIVSTKGNPGKKYGWIKLPRAINLYLMKYLYLIYHYGVNRKIDLNNNTFVEYGGKKIIFESREGVTTIGAPIFDIEWNLIGMYGGHSETLSMQRMHMEIPSAAPDFLRPKKLEGLQIGPIVRDLESFCEKDKNHIACKILELSNY